MSAPVSRQFLRSRTVEQLIAKNVAAGNNAASRVRPLKPDQLPATLVYTNRESGSNPSNDGPPQFDTQIELIIDGVIDEDSDEELDEALDSLADAVLAATLENADWLDGIGNVISLEIVKQPAGPDGMPVLGGVRVLMQIGVGLVIYSPEITTPLEVVQGLKDESGDFGIDVGGDGNIEIEFKTELPQT
tara:strand:- start:15911 stop:16477 length:567 start_codon:yes stop_codon:yes gene_type:complete